MLTNKVFTFPYTEYNFTDSPCTESTPESWNGPRPVHHVVNIRWKKKQLALLVSSDNAATLPSIQKNIPKRILSLARVSNNVANLMKCRTIQLSSQPHDFSSKDIQAMGQYGRSAHQPSFIKSVQSVAPPNISLSQLGNARYYPLKEVVSLVIRMVRLNGWLDEK